MKTIFCICIGLLCFILPSRKLKEYGEKLGEKTFAIAESNENGKESIAVQILYKTKRRNLSGVFLSDSEIILK